MRMTPDVFEPLRRFSAHLLLLGGALSFSCPGNAQTMVSGNIEGTWAASGNPYIVTDNATVPGGQTLTLQPGVEVWIAADKSITANGVIHAIGTPTRRITFQAPVASQYWNTISCRNAGGTNRFSYCDFRNASTALSLGVYSGNQVMHVEVANCSFTQCTTRAIYGEAVGDYSGFQYFSATLNPIIRNCKFDQTGSGCQFSVYGSFSRGYANPVIVGNIFSGLSGTAVMLDVGSYAGSSKLAFHNNTVIDCRTGIDSREPWDADVRNNVFVGLSDAVMVSGSLSRTVSYNCFHLNGADFVGYPPNYGQVILENRNGTPCDLTFNIFEDPLFAAATDLRLSSNSPCIDAGAADAAFAESCFPPSLGTAYSDLGAFGGPTACFWPLPCSAPAIVAQPQRQGGCLGYSVTFSVTATGTGPLRYQWFRDNVALAGETNPILSVANLQTSSAGLYSVVVSNECSSVTSTDAALVVHDACVDIHMYAGLRITGQPGQTYVVKYTTDGGSTDFATWTPLATNTLANSNWFYLDMESPFHPRRFYGVRLQP